MAKIVKDTRQTIDVDTELENIKKENSKRKTTKEEKKDNKKKDNKKKVKTKKKHFKFFREVKGEMDKVKWPSKKDMIKYSIATIVFVIFFALFFYGIDAVVALLKKLKEVI